MAAKKAAKKAPAKKAAKPAKKAAKKAAKKQDQYLTLASWGDPILCSEITIGVSNHPYFIA